MIFYILSFTLLICVNPLRSDATTTVNPNGTECEEMDKPGWSLFSLANKTLDEWPWSCLNSRYTETTLDEEISKLSPDIFNAISKNLLGYVQYFIDRAGVDLCDEVDENGETPMYVAIANGHLRIVKYFLSNDFGLSCKLLWTGTIEDFDCPVLWAAFYGQSDILKYLLQEIHKYFLRADKRTRGDERSYLQSFLAAYLPYKAAQGGQQHVLEYFVNKEGFIIRPDDELLLMFAAFGGNVGMLKYLLYEKNININATMNPRGDMFECGDITVLCNAAGGGKLDAVIFVVEALNNTELMNLNKTGLWSMPLIAAVKGGSLQVVKYMIEEKNADLNTMSDGDSILHIAVRYGHLDVLKYLVELKHMNVDSKNYKGATPLYEAITKTRLNVVKYLAGERNASLNVLSGSNALLESSGRNWSSRATLKKDLKIVKFLVDDVKMISRINEVDHLYETAAMKAAIQGKLDVLKFLVDDRHADIWIRPPTNMTLLHIVVVHDMIYSIDHRPNMQILKYLIEEKGFKVSARTSRNKTVLDMVPRSYVYEPVWTYLKEKLEQELSKNDKAVVPTTVLEE